MAVGKTAAQRALEQRRKNRRLPTVGDYKSDDLALNDTVAALLEHIRMYEGDSGAPKERFVTMAELENAGLLRADVKSGFAYVKQILDKDVAQQAGSTANPTQKSPVKKDTSRQGRVPGTSTTSQNQGPISYGSGGGGGGEVGRLGGNEDVFVASPAQNHFLAYDGTRWINFALFDTQNTWTKQQTFDKPLRLLELIDSPPDTPVEGYLLLWANTDGTIWLTNDAGASTQIAAGADHGGLSGLGDDDHPQYGALAQDEAVAGEWNFGAGIEVTGSRAIGNTDTLYISYTAIGGAVISSKSDDLLSGYVNDLELVGSDVIVNSGGLVINVAGGTTFDASGGEHLFDSGKVQVDESIEVDTINERVTAAGVTVDGVLIKDGLVDGVDVSDIPVSALADGTDGELITWSAAAAPTTVAAGTATQVLTSNGAGAAPTFQDATGGADPWSYDVLTTDDTNTTTTPQVALSFTPAANTRYIVEWSCMMSTSATNVDSQPSMSWNSGNDTGVGAMLFNVVSTSGTGLTTGFWEHALYDGTDQAFNFSTGMIANREYPFWGWAIIDTGATPTGDFELLHDIVTASTTSTMHAGSFLRYRVLSGTTADPADSLISATVAGAGSNGSTTVTGSSGITASRTASGDYQVSLPAPFDDNTAWTVALTPGPNAVTAAQRNIHVEAVSNGTVDVRQRTGSAAANEDFQIMVHKY